ncbi:MAG TPA: PilN domain-containing protein, partial [Solirubrobacterales bacterium]|nr:PilN domain-containing protein [Solirubrobacterales bacterium]
ATVLTSNQISDRKTERASLESQVAEAQAQAKRVQSFGDFAALQQAREQTVVSLAQSRFDWERVLRELAIVIPDSVWLTSLTGSASAESGSPSSSSSASSSVAEEVTGPSLDIEGCATGHEAVASFLAALRDIDGVTRVSVLKSDRPDSSGGGESTSSSAGGDGGNCATRDFISQFEIVAAFDAVPTAAGAAGSSGTSATAQPATSGSTATEADQSQVADGEQQLEQQKESSAKQTQKGRKAVDTLVPGTVAAP